MTTKNLPKQQQAGEVPAFLKADAGMGTEDITMDDIVVPRLKICQPLSTVKQTNKTLVDGNLYNSVSAEDLGESVDIYVLLKWNSVIWFDNQKLLATRYTDANTKETKTVGTPPAGDDGISCFNYMVVIANDLVNAIKTGVAPDILIYSASSAAQKAARKLNGSLLMGGRKGIPIFAQKVTISGILEKFDKGSAYMPVFKSKKFASEKEYEALKELHIACKEMQTKSGVHNEPEEKVVPQDNTVADVQENDNPFE